MLGYSPVLIERNEDCRNGLIDDTRTFNITLATRGLLALGEGELREKVMTKTLPIKGRKIHSEYNGIIAQPYGNEERHLLFSISRNDLTGVMLDYAQSLGIQVFFNARVSDLDLKKGRLDLEWGAQGSIRQTINCGPKIGVIGTDGTASVLRTAMQEQNGHSVKVETLRHAYKQMMLAPDANGKHRLDPEWLHVWPRGERTVTAIPMLNGGFSLILVLPQDEFYAFKDQNQYDQVLMKHFPELIALEQGIGDGLCERKIGLVRRTEVDRWTTDNKHLLLGDSAHSMSPT
jgi:kynurenine 3-monooxygenase